MSAMKLCITPPDEPNEGEDKPFGGVLIWDLYLLPAIIRWPSWLQAANLISTNQDSSAQSPPWMLFQQFVSPGFWHFIVCGAIKGMEIIIVGPATLQVFFKNPQGPQGGEYESTPCQICSRDDRPQGDVPGGIFIQTIYLFLLCNWEGSCL